MSDLNPIASTFPLANVTQIAIETTGRTGSIAVLSAEQVIHQETLGLNRRAAADIGPALQRAISIARALSDSIGFISVADGPGSFTGLRIGITTAKMLSYAIEAPLVAVDSVAAVGATVFAEQPCSIETPDAVLVALDAYRSQIFSGQLRRMELLTPLEKLSQSWSSHPDGIAMVDMDHWDDQLGQCEGEALLFAGDAKPFSKSSVTMASRSQADAVGVGLLGFRAATLGQWSDPFALIPRYLRGSAAEEKAAKQ
ncbi:tRNA threonylcarbamoyladenosine biosynthesis protein TsaB [Planctomycetes bacterium CA13]|uniref:tRNA threonylcarbamoyladenosine biosynthesis protein TsaB n=1 Tax=Novipirellula herctigrandis TaxID=2527986 RepID=A0A5C5Z3V5_9BACT|nr:tRNA threonylcarbamoyladenosine biosynthesis protein TsaB [Planctomycetes bacterium CA13]